MIPVSSDILKSLTSSNFELSIKLEIYDHLNQYLGELTEDVTTNIGSLNMDSNSPARRRLTITLDNSKSKYIFNEKSLIWLNKRLKFYIGINTRKGIEYVPQGVYVLTQPSNENTSDGINTTIELVDKSFLYTDKRGKLLNHLEIAEGAKITDTIKTVAQGAYETQFNFDNITDTVPYILSYQPDTSRWQIMQDLADMAKCHIFFDVNGFLRLKKIDLNEMDSLPVVWEFRNDGKDKFYSGSVRKFDEPNIANHIRVLGGNISTDSFMYDLVIDETNPIFTGNPYSIQQIGRIIYQHNQGNPDGNLVNLDDCKFRAKYELMRRAGYDEIISLNCFPHYLLEPDDVIWIDDAKNGIKGRYLVTVINMPISPQTMQIECMRQNRVIENWDFI